MLSSEGENQSEAESKEVPAPIVSTFVLFLKLDV